MSIKTVITTSVIVIVIIGGAFMYFASRPEESKARTVTALRQDVVQDVAFTGRLQPKQLSQLSFESIGTISATHVSVGDTVEPGQLLAQLETRLADLNIAKTSADLAATQEQKKISWQKAAEEYTNLQAQNARTLAKKQQVVRDEKIELDQYRAIHEQVAREQGENDSTTRTAVANVKLATTAYHAAQQALAETVKSNKAAEDTARQAADLAKAQYQATTQAAGNVAGLSSLEATAAIAQHNLTKQSITAPFSGTITTLDREVGETATSGATVVTVATVDQLELKASVTETDASKLAVNMTATITFDALPPQEQWTATLAEISPAAAIVEGVPTYEITLLIDNIDQRFRPGLTANITVHADTRSNVIAIPRRAVATRGGQQYVRVLHESGDIDEYSITTGLAGSTGTIEVISGLSEGDKVVIDTTGQ